MDLKFEWDEKKRLQQHEKQSLIMENRLPFMFRRQHLKR